MEKGYQSLSLLEFQKMFPDDQSCMEYLAKPKWPEGVACEKCNHVNIVRKSLYSF